VGSGARDVAQSGSPECAFLGVVLGDQVAAQIGWPLILNPHADVVEFVVGKKCVVLSDFVASGTVAFFGTGKDEQATFRRFAQGALIMAVVEAVKRRVSAHYGTLETGDGFCHHLEGNVAGAKG